VAFAAIVYFQTSKVESVGLGATSALLIHIGTACDGEGAEGSTIVRMKRVFLPSSTAFRLFDAESYTNSLPSSIGTR
jgi:hypothetical protein